MISPNEVSSESTDYDDVFDTFADYSISDDTFDATDYEDVSLSNDDYLDDDFCIKDYNMPEEPESDTDSTVSDFLYDDLI